jgi:hypothetical protein
MVNNGRQGSSRALARILAASALCVSQIAAGSRSAAQAADYSPLPMVRLPSALPAEAPASLFSARLGGAEAELLLKGTWTADAISALGLSKPRGGALALGSAQPLLFTQKPDLLLTFLLFKKLFVEARVTDDIAQARYSLGYRGGSDELIRELRVGNDKISFPSLPFLSFGAGSYRALGASALLSSPGFSGNAMLRYDQADRVVKRFVGGAEIVETLITVSEFAKGRWFATSSAPAFELAIFLESQSGTLIGGDGKRYRRLSSEEFSFSAADGYVALAQEATTRVLASYAASGAAPATVPLEGTPCELLYDPAKAGAPTPQRQILCRYPTLADPSSSDAFVRMRASGLRDATYAARVDPGGFIEVTRGSLDPRDSGFSLPFGVDMPWLYVTDFSDAGTLFKPSFTHEIVIRSRGQPSTIRIDAGFVQGSVEVRRNGQVETAFRINTDDGELILATPPGATEEVEVSYLRETGERRAGSLAAGIGGVWDFGGGQTAWAALGMRWAVPGTSYAAEGLDNPGSATFTAGESGGSGGFRHKSALAGTYTREEASGRYRIEGMESAGAFSTSFMPEASDQFASVEEISEKELTIGFPTLIAALHSDGSRQKALKIVAGTSGGGALAKIETMPPYLKFKTLSFFVKSSAATGTAIVALDGGPGSATFASISLPLVQLAAGKWYRISIAYGSGDPRVYARSSEGSPPFLVMGAAASLDLAAVDSARLHIALAGFDPSSAELWLDEFLLEDSAGRTSLIVQGELSYEGKDLKLAAGPIVFIDGLDLRGDIVASYQHDPFAAGGAALKTRLGPLSVAAQVRGGIDPSGRLALRGGHALALGEGVSGFRISDTFEFDPTLSSFGRGTTVGLSLGSLASLDLGQTSTWSPSASLSSAGSLFQEWTAKAGLAAGALVIEAKANNKASASEIRLSSGDYVEAWRNAFSYALPALETSAEKRGLGTELAFRLGSGRELLSASLSSSAEPRNGEEGMRRDAASAKLSLPLAFGGIKLTAHYARSWKDLRHGTGPGLFEDAALVAADFRRLDLFYRSLPLSELFDRKMPAAFEAELRAADGIAEALFSPEIGASLSREFGSYWWDLAFPAAFSLDLRRELAAAGDSRSDSLSWVGTAKWAAVNLFGSEGSYPLGMGFASDEYFSTIQATIREVSSESRPRYRLQSQQLASFYSGAADSLGAESRLTIAAEPGARSWSEQASLSYSRREEWSLLLDLYRRALPAARARADPPSGGGEGTGASFASLYLRDIAARDPIARTSITIALKAGGISSDAATEGTSWRLEETWASKLTVPERLTITASAMLSQAIDGKNSAFAFGAQIGLGASISF